MINKCRVLLEAWCASALLRGMNIKQSGTPRCPIPGFYDERIGCPVMLATGAAHLLGMRNSSLEQRASRRPSIEAAGRIYGWDAVSANDGVE